MDVIINGASRKVRFTSIILERDPNDPHNQEMHLFHCPRCANPIAQYQGEIVWILPGQTIINPVSILQCRHCKRKYSLQGIAT